jgi:acyl carrier protein
MDIKEFIEKFVEATEVGSVDTLSADSKFRELDDWSSLAGLSVIAMFDMEFDITINGNDIRACQTIQDLYDLIAAKQ